MRIGIISDTHGRLRPEVAERLRGVDCILHAGDFDDPSVMEALDRLAPVYGVRGNNDWGGWAQELPRLMRIDLGDPPPFRRPLEPDGGGRGDLRPHPPVRPGADHGPSVAESRELFLSPASPVRAYHGHAGHRRRGGIFP